MLTASWKHYTCCEKNGYVYDPNIVIQNILFYDHLGNLVNQYSMKQQQMQDKCLTDTEKMNYNLSFCVCAMNQHSIFQNLGGLDSLPTKQSKYPSTC